MCQKKYVYHLNEAGEPLRCTATKGRCPYAEDKHFTSKEKAREAFEELQSSSLQSVSQTVAHEMTLSTDVTDLLDKLYAKKLRPYIVGGSVRDSLLSGEVPKDIDIEVFGADNMDQLETLLKKSGYKVDSVGKSFGVLTMRLPNGEDIDISLPRQDSKKGDGHRGFDIKVDPKLSMEEAAGRRDYTINALYYSHKEKLVKDLFGGLEDYRKGQLRHINKHFDEDALRVIRGAQFAARFKMRLSSETAEFCTSLRSEFSTLPTERLQTEFDKMFSKSNVDVTYGLAALKQTGWDVDLKLSKLSSKTGNDINACIARAKEVKEDTTVFGAAKLLQASELPDRAFIADCMVSKLRRQNKALALAKTDKPQALNHKAVREWAREIGKSGLTVKDYYILSGDENVREAAIKAKTFDAPIQDMLTGAKLLEYSNQKPGPWMGKLLREAAKAQDQEIFTDEKSAIEWAKSRLNKLQNAS